ncbi:MAG: hypothetical protein R2716_08730 [Microthrixaceae bacterium]
MVFYDIAAHEEQPCAGARSSGRCGGWAAARFAGRFVNGFSGEQFALPEAVDALKQVRRSEADGRTVSVSATDPLNVTGVVLPVARVPARRCRGRSKLAL